MAQLTGFLDCIALRQASLSESANADTTMDALLASTYEEGRAIVIAKARDLLGHERVDSICNGIVRHYFCGRNSYLLYTLDYGHNNKTYWRPRSDAVTLAADQELLQIVSRHAGLFKHDLAMRGFNLTVVTDGHTGGVGGWDVSRL